MRTTRKKLGELVAKENLKTVNDEQDIEEKGPGFFKKLFLFVLIPLVFIIAILLIVATFTNTNVFQTAQNITSNIPFISSKEEVVENSSLNEEKVVTLQAEIQQKEAEIASLQTQITTSSNEKQELVIELERMQYEIEKLQRAQEEAKKEFNEILSTFEKMSAKKAAPILVEMSDTEALRILASMRPDTLSEVLTKMTPAQAARYTELLAQQ